MLSSHEPEPSAEALAEIRSRLASVCSSYGEAELEALVREIAAVRAKYDRIKTEYFFLSLTADLDACPHPGGPPPRAD
jgi:hypothetical protein